MRMLSGLLAAALVFCCPVGPAFAQAAAHLAERSDAHSHDGVEHSHEHEGDHHGPLETSCADADLAASPGLVINPLKAAGVLPAGDAFVFKLTPPPAAFDSGPPLFVPRLLLSRAPCGRAPPA